MTYGPEVLTEDLLRRHQAWYPGDSTQWQRTARLLQSLWRSRRGLPAGGDEPHSGSRLPDTEETRSGGLAYISDDARAAVRAALDSAEKGAVLEQTRLWTNLLSSQPLCFNLFGPLSERVNDPTTVAALRTLWPDIATVTRIRYEHSPGRNDPRFLDNGTAFDVFVEYDDTAGRQRFVAIEVRYHEDQLLLDHLLALSMNEAGPRTGRFVILYPAANTAIGVTVDDYRSHLADGDDSFEAMTLEHLVASWRTVIDDHWLLEFDARYLDTAVLRTLAR